MAPVILTVKKDSLLVYVLNVFGILADGCCCNTLVVRVPFSFQNRNTLNNIFQIINFQESKKGAVTIYERHNCFGVSLSQDWPLTRVLTVLTATIQSIPGITCLTHTLSVNAFSVIMAFVFACTRR